MQGGIILAYRTLPSYKDMWHLPGGTVRYKETIEQAVNRVAQDELHMSVQMVRPLGYMEFPSEEKERGFGSAVSIPIICLPHSTEFQVGEGASEARVFTELPDAMIPEQKVFLSSHWAEIVT
jgi:ADP-ribose pyrophosphatase YjhB (NUDIX family)